MYTNRNIIDAFACLMLDKKTQYTVRASRELRPQIDETAVGPFSYRVIEPLKRIRYALAENDFGLSFDLEFEGVMPCYEEDPQFARSKGRVIENIVRYDQPGRGRGWIKADGQTYEFNESPLYVERDHSWGIRRTGASSEPNAQPSDIPEGFMYSWSIIQFPTWGAAYHIRENADGTRLLTSGGILYPYGEEKEEQRIVSVEHDFQMRSDARKFKSGRLLLTCEDGTQRDLAVRPLTFCCLKTGGYFEYDGFAHGKWMGSSWCDGFKHDLSDPAVLAAISFMDNNTCEFRCGSEIGYGTLEFMIIGKNTKYGYAGY